MRLHRKTKTELGYIPPSPHVQRPAKRTSFKTSRLWSPAWTAITLENLFSVMWRSPSLANLQTQTLFPTHKQITSPNPHPPADGSLARDDVTLAVIEAEVSLQLTDTLTGQAIHAEVASITDALRFPRPFVHFTLRIFVACLELARVGLVAWKLQTQRSADLKSWN